MLIPIFFLVCGFIMLGAGAEFMVSGSSKLAIRLGISPLIVGLTLVAFGTSSPELAVSIESIAADRSPLALGNIIGSNIANIGLVLGITAMIAPIKIEGELVRKQIPMMIGATLLMSLLIIDGELSYADGFILTSGLLGYLILSYTQANSEFDPDELNLDTSKVRDEAGASFINFVWIIGGLGLLILGSQVFVENAVTLARLLGMSEALIGLTLVAIGTSVPELATSLIAAFRNQADIAVGNIVGSNIFNILCVLGITALIGAISTEGLYLSDLVAMILITFILFPMARSGLSLSRIEGALLLMLYICYLLVLILIP